MKVYVKYKTKISYDSIWTFVKFRIKIRIESEEYGFFRNIFTKHLIIDSWEETEKLLEDDGLLKLEKMHVEKYLYEMRYKQSENVAVNNVHKLLNKDWKEVELIIE